MKMIADNQDKQAWCQAAIADEKVFARKLRVNGHDAGINPEKEKNIYAPDLVVDGELGDYKHEQTPFFTAERYGVPAAHAYTFNVKDFTRYRELYPGLFVWVHLEWEEQEDYGIRVEASNRLYKIPFAALVEKLETGTVPCHTYLQRRKDKGGNARQSFIFNVQDFERYRR